MNFNLGRMVRVLGAVIAGVFITYIFLDKFSEPPMRDSLLMPVATQVTEPGLFKEFSGDNFEIDILDEYVFSVSDHVQNMAKQHTTFYGGQNRRWYEFSPVSEAEIPLVILLHGAGHGGLSMLQMWEDTARFNGIALVAPNSPQTQWSVESTPAEFLDLLVEEMSSLYNIDEDRIFLFGHSSGAGFAQLLINRFDGPWRAAVLHAGYASPKALMPPMRPKPFRLYLGEYDHIFNIDVARQTGRKLASQGQTNELVVIPNHTHWFYDAGPQIAEDAWRWFEEQ